jgi:hypothetical protein
MNATTLNQMLLAFWRQRDRESPWGRRLLIALAAAGVCTSLYFAPQGWWQAVLCASAVLILASLWMTVMGSLLEQNHPHAARFVPGHLRQLREAALGSWALVTLVCAVLLWMGLPKMPSFMAMLLFTAATLAFAGWAVRNWLLWLVLSIGPVLFFAARLDKRLAWLWSGLAELWRAQPASVLTLSLLVLGGSIAWLFGAGDAAHREAYAARMRMRRAGLGGINKKRGAQDVLGRPGEWISRPFDHATAAWLRHVLACAQASERSVMSRIEIVLHGQQHWLRQGMGVAVGLAIAVLSFGLAFALSGAALEENWKRGAFGLAIGLASMGFNPAFALPNMLWQSRREQALLRLLPGVPQGQAQNRAVAWLQLRHMLVAWLLTTASLALLAWAADDLALLSLSFCALPLCILSLMRVPARMRGPSAWAAALPALAFVLSAWGLYALHQKLGVSLTLMAAACLGLSLVLGLSRWRIIQRAPQALPTGHAA